MNFRTQVDVPQTDFRISHGDGIVMLGSCFTDNIAAMLMRDGFNVVANPMGVMYNPVAIANLVNRAVSGRRYCLHDLVQTPDGVWHCLDFVSQYQSADADELLSLINSRLDSVANDVSHASVVAITLGTAYVFTHLATGAIVGNCHKLSAHEFSRRRLSVVEIADALAAIISLLPGKRIIFTVSPIRHVADGLHGNNLSKATLHLAIDAVGGHYFPAFEIVCDDLRDYRFYADDLKHPSAMAVNYIYEIFGKTYFSASTAEQAILYRKAAARAAHRPILSAKTD